MLKLIYPSTERRCKRKEVKLDHIILLLLVANSHANDISAFQLQENSQVAAIL